MLYIRVKMNMHGNIFSIISRVSSLYNFICTVHICMYIYNLYGKILDTFVQNSRDKYFINICAHRFNEVNILTIKCLKFSYVMYMMVVVGYVEHHIRNLQNIFDRVVLSSFFSLFLQSLSLSLLILYAL